MKMPSSKYDKVLDNGSNINIQMPDEEAFHQGIIFNAKLVGIRDVPQPSSRVEIVTAMRRIRYECKVKSFKKTKVTINISVNGIRVMRCKAGKQKKHQQQCSLDSDDSPLLLQKYPIFRIFYVSHDSQDLHIFSYIARDDALETFQCSVFKAYKRSQAMQIVRTIGQAFDMCHKVNTQSQGDKNDMAAAVGECISQNNLSQPSKQGTSTVDGKELRHCQWGTLPFDEQYFPYNSTRNSTFLRSLSEKSESADTAATPLTLPARQMHRASVAVHGLKMSQEHMTLQVQQTHLLRAEVQRLQTNLEAESVARQQLQTRTQELMTQNRELIDHIDILVSRLSEMEGYRRSIDVSGVQRLTRLSTGSSYFGSRVPPSPAISATQPTLRNSVSYLEPSDFVGISPSVSLNQMGSLQFSGKHSRAVSVPSSIDSVPLKPKPKPKLLREKAVSELEAVEDVPEQQQPQQQPQQQSVIIPMPAQDATGNRLELGMDITKNIPRLKPPPKVSRTYDQTQLTEIPYRNKSSQSQEKSSGSAEKRYSWDCHTTVVANIAIKSAACVNNSAVLCTLPKKKKHDEDKHVTAFNCSAYTINGVDMSTVSSSGEGQGQGEGIVNADLVTTVTSSSDVTIDTATMMSTSSCGGFETHTENSYGENDSASSKDDVRLSFSDDECFIDVPAAVKSDRRL